MSTAHSWCKRLLSPLTSDLSNLIEDPPNAEGLGSRPWEAFRRVLEDLGEHSDQTQSVVPSDQWRQWFLGLDERVPFSPSDAADLERSLWFIMEKVTCGKPSYTFTPREYGWEHHDREVRHSRHRPPPITQLQLAKWRHWRPAQLRDLEPTTQRALEEKLRQHWSNRLISHLAPHASEIPAMAAVMGDGNDHEEFLHLLGDARFSTLRQRCLAFEKLKKHGVFRSRGQKNQSVLSSAISIRKSVLQTTSSRHGIPWSGSVLCFRPWASQPPNVLHRRRNGYRRPWSPQRLHRSERQWSQPRRSSLHWKRGRLPVALTLRGKAKWPGRPLMHSFWEWSDSKWGVVPASMIFNTRVQVQWRSHPTRLRWWPGRLKHLSFPYQKNPVPLIAPKLSLSGVDWWTEWSKTLTLLSSLERFRDMDYLIPTLSKDFQGVIPRPSTSDRGLRWLKEALVLVDQDLVTPLTWHSFRVFIPDCAYQLGIPRAQRQYLGNWQTESTADIYTREKRMWWLTFGPKSWARSRK